MIKTKKIGEENDVKSKKMTEEICTVVVPASNASKEAADNLIFLVSEFSMFNVGPEIIKPPQSATFAASSET